MAKRKTKKSILKTKLTKPQIIVSILLTIIIYISVTSFLFSTIGGPPTQTQIPTPTITSTPSPQSTNIEPLPNINLNVLRVFQARYSHENIPIINFRVINTQTANKLYDDIQNLPFWPPGIYNCPNDNGIIYNLSFYSNDVLTVAAIINPNGCPGVRFVNDRYKSRSAMNRQGRKLLDDLQQALQLSKQEFYGQ